MPRQRFTVSPSLDDVEALPEDIAGGGGDISAVIAGIGLTGGGEVGDISLAVDTAVIATQADLVAEQAARIVDVDNEEAARTGADNTLQGNIDAEAAFRAAADAELAPDDATYVTLSATVGLDNERVLTGTANQITVTDGGAGTTVTLSAPQDLHTAATPTFGAGTYTPGAAHTAFTVSPIWTAENFAHTALGVTATQNGVNSNATGLVGLNLAMVKATIDTTLAQMTIIRIPALSIAAHAGPGYSVTTLTGMLFPDLGVAGIGTFIGIDFPVQTNPAAGGARCIRIQGTAGTGIGAATNTIQFNTGASNRVYLGSPAAQALEIISDSATGAIRLTVASAGGIMSIAAQGTNSSLALSANGTGSVTLQNSTFTPGASHIASTISPTWSSPAGVENYTALGITATQNGTNTGTLTALSLAITKATAAGTTLAASVALEVPAPAVTGTLTSATGIHIANQAAAAVNAFGIDIDSQTAGGAGQYRAIRINGTGVLNALQLDTSASSRRKYLYSSGVNTTDLAGDAASGGLQFTTGAAGGAMAIAAFGANSSLSIDSNGTGALGLGTGATAKTITIGNAASTAVNTNALTMLFTTVNALTLTDGTGSFALGGTGIVTLSGATSFTLTQSVQAAPGAAVAWTITAGAHTAIATAADFTGALLVSAATWTLADSATVTDGQSVRFMAPTFSGVAGGGTETITNPATVYIVAAPTNGGSITFTNTAAALRVGGLTKLEAGVTFAASGQSTLSNYTEGTWTPDVTTDGTEPAYSSYIGRYTRIGNRVFVDIYLSGDGGAEGAGGTYFRIDLPITAGASHPAQYFPAGYYINFTGKMECNGSIAGGGTYIQLQDQTSHTDMTAANQNGTDREIRLKFFYEV